MARNRLRAADKRYVTARSTMQTVGVCVGAYDALWQCHNSRELNVAGNGAATNRPTIPRVLYHCAGRIKVPRRKQSQCIDWL